MFVDIFPAFIAQSFHCENSSWLPVLLGISQWWKKWKHPFWPFISRSMSSPACSHRELTTSPSFSSSCSKPSDIWNDESLSECGDCHSACIATHCACLGAIPVHDGKRDSDLLGACILKMILYELKVTWTMTWYFWNPHRDERMQADASWFFT